MANMNTVAGWQNLPAQVITVNTEVALLVPAVGVYPGLPSPLLPAASGLTVSAPQDQTGFGSGIDLHVFRIRLAAKIANPGAGNVTLKIYQVPLASLGTISATGSVTTAGAPGSGDNVFDSLTAFTTPANPSHFFMEWYLMWDVGTARLDGYHVGMSAANTAVTPAVISNPLSSNVAAISALNFLPSFTFATANAANSVQVSEFVVDRV